MSAIVVQCYNKADTLALTLNALLKCQDREKFNLIIWQDSEIGNHKQAQHAPQREAATAVVRAMLPMLEKAFASVEYHVNPANLGCYETCRQCIDYAFETNDFVIFTEDDGIFTEDALVWFEGAREFPEYKDEKCRAITGESIFFNAGSKPLSRVFRHAIAASANKTEIGLNYVTFNFVTSTVFALDKEKWALIREVRGEINGDVTLCKICDEHKYTCVFPVVARVMDIGMRHAQGYSVGIHSAANVDEKNTYLSTDDLVTVYGTYSPYAGSRGRLYDLTANLKDTGLSVEEIYALRD